jgi:SAM-dependent methyltransferase
MTRIDDTELVRTDYAKPERLATRFKPFREYHRGDLEGRVLQLVAEGSPRDVLEIGSGDGSFSDRMRSELSARVVSIDLSEHMVELARSRGLDARVGDAQNLPFPDESFDTVVANWMLYHVPDLDRALAEVRRVLRPGGRLVAVTMSSGSLREVWDMLPDDGSTPQLSFSRRNGASILARHFPHVLAIDLAGQAVFPDREAVVEYVGATLTRAHLADQVPHFDGPLVASTSNVAFVAERPQVSERAA